MKRLSSGVALGALVAAAALVPDTTASAAPPSSDHPAPSIRTEQGAAATMARDLGLGAQQRLTVTGIVPNPSGSYYVRYSRTFAGLPVVHGDVVVERSRAGAVQHVDWAVGQGKVAVASTTPAVSLASAKAKGLQATSAVKGERVDSHRLVVFVTQDGRPHLAYDVLTQGVTADQTPTRLHTYVDAHTGATLASHDEVETGTGHGIFVGNVQIGTQPASSGYQVKDSVGNYTTNLRGATSGTGSIFTGADDDWGNGSQSNPESAGVDAQYGAEMTYDFYQNVMGRAGIWDNGSGARSRVHYGNNYVNAFWDGTQMTYGDGANNQHPLVELDVAGHEMSHGVTENTAGLTYSGDAGGLNEATSDIFGTAVEWYANNPNDVPDYLIGEEININGDGTPLRYMDKPSRAGTQYPNCYSSNVKNLDPHYASAPLNHWFYLASEGSGAKTINGVSYNSPTCNGSTVQGIGHVKAEKIWYHTLATKLGPYSTYTDARDGAIASAKELYGDGTECAGVQAAFSAISVPAGSQSCSGGTTPPPSGSNLLKNPGFESGAVSWTGTSGPITNNSGRRAHSGTWKLWLGGNGRTASENESQSVTLPSASTASKATLSYWLAVDTDDYPSGAYDTMKVQVVSGGTAHTLKSYSNLDADGGTYHQVSVDVSKYLGQSVQVKFVMNEDAYYQTSFVVDDTSLTVS
ncbi:MAG TPA: M4 family metallopeptidase [Segeticoccus sp.]|uniref:M4 family metallopeptidase n=1 Tax=Segeticoccus sp. TaxID=2706531 RepID=UPI002D80BA65|nr:M4 family metallopeptidase [Segeticoccus sp.]HET8601920.1 M4 family metallopeptidase [Segeticoccus sp.]